MIDARGENAMTIVAIAILLSFAVLAIGAFLVIAVLHRPLSKSKAAKQDKTNQTDDDTAVMMATLAASTAAMAASSAAAASCASISTSCD
jgi:Na+/proline symporter